MQLWKIRLAMCAGALVLAGCSDGAETGSAQDMISEVDPAQAGDGDIQNSFGFYEAMEQGPDLDPFGEDGPKARDSLPRLPADRSASKAEGQPGQSSPEEGAQTPSQIAYSYGFGFQIEQEKIPELQQAHVEICKAMNARCRILRMSQAGTDSWDGYGELQLQVEESRAQTFGRSLKEPAEALGGEQVSFVVDGEDLSETIIDTEARLASRIVLRDKLTEILRNNRGSVDELVKAEKAVANVNEEIDAARTKLEKLRNRLQFSAVSIEYSPEYGRTDTGLVRPVVTAFQSIGSTFGKTVAILIYVATALVPITLFILLLRWIFRRLGWSLRFWRRKAAKD